MIRGKPVARILPFEQKGKSRKLGFAKDIKILAGFEDIPSFIDGISVDKKPRRWSQVGHALFFRGLRCPIPQTHSNLYLFSDRVQRILRVYEAYTQISFLNDYLSRRRGK